MISLVETLKHYNYQSANIIIQRGIENQNTLWLGDFTAAIDRDWQKLQNIQAILTVAEGLNIEPQPNILHHVINAQDHDAYDISKDFDEGCEFINSSIKNGSILVHCAAGVSRSAAIVICYLMRTYNWTYLKAYNHVKNCRPIVFPNQGFVRTLLKEQQKIQNKVQTQNMRVTFVKILTKSSQANIKNTQPGKFVYLRNQPSPIKRERINNSEYYLNRPNYNIINLYKKKGSLKPLLGGISNQDQPISQKQIKVGDNSVFYNQRNELRETFLIQKPKRQCKI